MVLAESPLAVDLVMVDMVMPETSGLPLRWQFWTPRPTRPVLLMCGDTEEAITRLGGSGPLQSPIDGPFPIHGIQANSGDLLGAGAPDA